MDSKLKRKVSALTTEGEGKEPIAKEYDEEKVETVIDDADSAENVDPKTVQKKKNKDLLNIDAQLRIPSPESIRSGKINPIILGQKIANAEDTKNANIKKLTDLVNEYDKNTREGKFYRAALAAVKEPEKARQYWLNQMKVPAAGARNLVGVGNEIRRFGEADPLGTFSEGAKALAYGRLADDAKNAAKTSDFAFDTIDNANRGLRNGRDTIRRTAKGAVGLIPLAGPALNFAAENLIDPIVIPSEDNFDDGVDTSLSRLRFLIGEGLDDASQNYALVRDETAKNYRAKEKRLQRALGRDRNRRLQED